MTSSSPSFFSLLCVLLISQISLGCARYIAQKTSNDKGDILEDPSVSLFFRIEDLKVGNKFPIYYPRITVEKKIMLLPREIAETIPFSSKHLPLLLKKFNLTEDSPEAEAMAYTLQTCEREHAHIESKFCAISLESMLDQLRGFLGQDAKIDLLTTTLSPGHKMDIQNYTVVEEPELMETEKAFGCHGLPFPFRVYFCHAQLKDRKVFKIKLVGDDGEKVESPAICHADTSQWRPTHPAFKVLKTEPGKSTICHFTPADNFVWIMSPNHSAMQL